jgi:hypothetical protein
VVGLGRDRLPVLPPSHDDGSDVALQSITPDAPFYMRDEDVDLSRIHIQVAVTFRDASNGEWWRDGEGRLDLVRNASAG